MNAQEEGEATVAEHHEWPMKRTLSAIPFHGWFDLTPRPKGWLVHIGTSLRDCPYKYYTSKRLPDEFKSRLVWIVMDGSPRAQWGFKSVYDDGTLKRWCICMPSALFKKHAMPILRDWKIQRDWKKLP